MRFWDGQAWTASTAAIPQARESAPAEQPAMAGAFGDARPQAVSPGFSVPSAPSTPHGALGSYSVTLGASTPTSQTPPPSGVAAHWKVIVAVVAVMAIAIGVAVPTVFSSHQKAASPAFSNALLTASAVTAIGGQTYSLAPLSKPSTQAGDSAQCSSFVDDGIAGSKTTASAARGFTAADGSQDVIEIIASNPAFPQAMDQLQSTLKSCSATSFDGSITVNSAPISIPAIDGSDGTIAVELTGLASGTTLVMDVALTRFGDNIVALMVASVNPQQSQQSLLSSLLSEASYDARPAFSKS